MEKFRLKCKFLSRMPVALRKIFDYLKEPVVVIDNFNKIIEYNRAFAANFLDDQALTKNYDIHVFVNDLKGKIRPTGKDAGILSAIEFGTIKPVEEEICLLIPVEKHYLVIVRPLFANNRETAGRIVSWSDISNYKRLTHELNLKNIELAVTRERNRLALDIHEPLRQTMSLLIMQLELVRRTYSYNPAVVDSELSKAINFAREGLLEVKHSIFRLTPENLRTQQLLAAINSLIADFGSSGLQVELTVEGLANLTHQQSADALYRICREALANSLQHGKAGKVTIMLRFTKIAVKLFINDDGLGCADIKKGSGLAAMEELIKELAGNIFFGSEAGRGFNIYVEIPLADASN